MTRSVKILIIILLTSARVFSQENSADRLAITSNIQTLFDAMRLNDSTNLSVLFTPEAIIETIVSENDTPIKKIEKAGVFIENVGKPHLQKWDERPGNYNITVSGNYAVVTMDYVFYLDNLLHHCGVNTFELLKTGSVWKIDKITNTRLLAGCADIPVNSVFDREKLKNDTLSVNSFLNNWHQAAAKADETLFFDSMDQNGIYIGTDATECWNRQEFYTWAIKYFQRESAWAFTPKSRNVYFSTDGTIVWFNELLDTWMGVCRGSGTLHLEPDGWKIYQYHLAVTVPNNKIKEFIELLK